MEPLGPYGAAVLCEGRIPGAQKFGKSWAVPANAEKPKDPRKLQGQAAEGAASLVSGLLDHTSLMPFDELTLPAGTLPGSGGGHACRPTKRHCVGGVPLFQRTGWGSGTGGGGLI